MGDFHINFTLQRSSEFSATRFTPHFSYSYSALYIFLFNMRRQDSTTQQFAFLVDLMKQPTANREAWKAAPSCLWLPTVFESLNQIPFPFVVSRNLGIQ